ncbi:MAG: SSS family solute:Na+ symporter [Lysobacterales bacterium]|jgi:SSS family solute:Na+ symporter
MDSSTQTTILVGTGLYVLVMLAIGLFVSKKSTDLDDFAASGRNMSMSVCAISIIATWFGAGPMMGSAAAAYSGNKLEVLRDPLVSGIALIIAGFFFVRTYNRSRRLTHIAFYETRIGDLAGIISIFVNLVAGTIWLGAVLFAFGVVFESLTGQSAALGILGGTLVIVVYTMFGGLKAVAATDVVQMAFIIIGVLILFYVVLDDAGGWATIAPQLPAHAFDFTPEAYDLKSMTAYMQVWLSSGLAAIGVLSLVQRAAAARSEQVAQNAFYIGGLGYLAFGMIPVIIGYIAAVTMPGVENPNAIIPLLAVEHLHPVLVAIFVGAVISAIMSTSDSILLGCGTVISVNLLPRFKAEPSDELSLRVARWSIPVIAIFSLYFAFNTSSVISAIGLAVSIGFAGMSAPFLLVIWWKKLTSIGGYSGIASGFTVFAVMKFIEADFSASFAGFYVSLIVAVTVSLTTQNISPPRPLTMADGEPLDLENRFGTLPLFKRID